ncbi:hypothetical protein ANTQUA_LOCUS10444 [Anthophora quadrimaculata]
MDTLFDSNKRIKNILANQTSLIKKILNNESLQHLESVYNELRKQQQWDKTLTKFIIELDSAIQSLHFQIDEILNAIILGKQGIISPQLIPPEEFIQNYAKLSDKDIYNIAISPKIENYQYILDISELHLFTTNDKLFFKITIPLVLPQEWNIVRVYPIPAKQNNIFMAPVIEHPIFLISNLVYMNTDLEYLSKYCKKQIVMICKQTFGIDVRQEL